MKSKTTVYNFGERLARFRKARGLTQGELAEKLNISRRIITYYESKSEYPPAHLLVPISKVLKASMDDLLGIKKTAVSDENYAALWRRLKKVHNLPKADQKALFHYLNALLQKNKHK